VVIQQGRGAPSRQGGFLKLSWKFHDWWFNHWADPGKWDEVMPVLSPRKHAPR
jgi:hypothetical protein